jgi:hypothetical protein
VDQKVIIPQRTGFRTTSERKEQYEYRAKRRRDKQRRNALTKKTPEILPITPNRLRKKRHYLPAVVFVGGDGDSTVVLLEKGL